MNIREICQNDQKEYLDLLFQLSNFKWNDFNLDQDKNRLIFVIEHDGSIIGAASLFILNKLHCNPVGQIEDVVISDKYRKLGLGKKLVDHLVKIAFSKKCYKVVLNSLKHNEDFYTKCGFSISGVQFKI